MTQVDEREPTPAAVLDRWPLAIGSSLLRKPDRSASRVPIQRHLDATLDWIKAAHTQSIDGGIPAYYDLLRGRWRPSYPETTGYMIPTLYACADRLGQPHLGALGVSLADYLLRMRTPEGGVAHWDKKRENPGVPVVFDTGQVIFGWLASWRRTGNVTYRDASIAAAEWLGRIQDPTGAWRQFQHLGTVKVIDARVAWALLELGRAADRQDFVQIGRRNLDWVLTQQQPNGWFRSAAFESGRDPFTHTIAYTAEGLLESGLIAENTRYVAAAQLVADTLLPLQRKAGDLASAYDPFWRESEFSSCLTGNCQMALLWLRFYELTAEPCYLEAARRAVGSVAATQNMFTANDGIRGGVAGSYPLFGPYERMKYPNWAAKFFIDALLALEAAEDNRPLPERIG